MYARRPAARFDILSCDPPGPPPPPAAPPAPAPARAPAPRPGRPPARARAAARAARAPRRARGRPARGRAPPPPPPFRGPRRGAAPARPAGAARPGAVSLARARRPPGWWFVGVRSSASAPGRFRVVLVAAVSVRSSLPSVGRALGVLVFGWGLPAVVLVASFGCSRPPLCSWPFASFGCFGVSALSLVRPALPCRGAPSPVRRLVGGFGFLRPPLPRRLVARRLFLRPSCGPLVFVAPGCSGGAFTRVGGLAGRARSGYLALSPGRAPVAVWSSFSIFSCDTFGSATG